MAVAAVPDYLGEDFSEASPGMRFSMYLQVWSATFAKEKEKVAPLKRAGKLNSGDKQIMAALFARQQASFQTNAGADSSVRFGAITISPFTTGLGNEHPLENGFAFLNPYGLPYLPGSGVKGVLRQAARELVSDEWGDAAGWSEGAITALFGLQSDDGDLDHQRGALTFWDVIPQIKGDQLSVEIMTPHQKHYYQEGKTPHDSGQPVPISFLTVPPGSGFTFHVQCNRPLLEAVAPELAADNRWQALLQAAFEHAFEWLGFGAKTAVGYGAMVDKAKLKAAEERVRQEGLQAAGITVGTSVWQGAKIVTAHAGSGEIEIKHPEGKLARGNFYSQLSDAAKKKLKKKKNVMVNAEIEELGNLITILTIEEVNE